MARRAKNKAEPMPKPVIDKKPAQVRPYFIQGNVLKDNLFAIECVAQVRIEDWGENYEPEKYKICMCLKTGKEYILCSFKKEEEVQAAFQNIRDCFGVLRAF